MKAALCLARWRVKRGQPRTAFEVLLEVAAGSAHMQECTALEEVRVLIQHLEAKQALLASA